MVPVPKADDAHHLYQITILVRAPANRNPQEVWAAVSALIVLYGEGKLSTSGFEAAMANYTLLRSPQSKRSGLIQQKNDRIKKTDTEVPFMFLTPAAKRKMALRRKAVP